VNNKARESRRNFIDGRPPVWFEKLLYNMPGT